MQIVKYLPGILLFMVIVLSILRRKKIFPSWLIIPSIVVTAVVIIIATMLIISKN